MQQLTKALLDKVKSSISLRVSNPEAYTEAFRKAETFITATINNKLEFVPLQLLFLSYNKFQILLEVKAVFGTGIEHAQLDDLLIKFYNDYDLKRDIDSLSGSVKYHIKPQPATSKSEQGIFNWSKLNELSEYGGRPYRASDPQLKEIGQLFAEQVMHPTNTWGEKIVPKGYILERERYWQVAGNFKSFTWAKLKHKDFQEEQVFISVGVDIEKSALIFKLDCLRSGTHKLSNYDIRKFDYYTQYFNCITEIDRTVGEAVGWEMILKLSAQFIEEFETVYLGVVNYIWGSKIDLALFNSKVFSVNSEEIKVAKGKAGSALPELLYNIALDSVITYEQYMLNHADKADLAALVKFTFDGLYQIQSFEFDGQHKQIFVVANTGSPATPFELSKELRDHLSENDHSYIYQIYDYDEISNCGKLIIRRGDPKVYAKLDPVKYAVTVK